MGLKRRKPKKKNSIDWKAFIIQTVSGVISGIISGLIVGIILKSL